MYVNKDSNMSLSRQTMSPLRGQTCQCCIRRGSRSATRNKWFVLFGILLLHTTTLISAMTLSNKTPSVVHSTNGDPAPGRSPGPPGSVPEHRRRFPVDSDTWTPAAGEGDVGDYSRGNVKERGESSVEEISKKLFDEEKQVIGKSGFDNRLQRKREARNGFIEKDGVNSYKIEDVKIYRGAKLKDVNLYKEEEPSRMLRNVNEIFDSAKGMKAERIGFKSEHKDKNLNARHLRQKRFAVNDERVDPSYLVGDFVRKLMRNQRHDRELPDDAASYPDGDLSEEETQNNDAYFTPLSKRTDQANNDKASVQRGAETTGDVHNNNGDHPTMILTAQPAADVNVTWCEEVQGDLLRPEVVESDVGGVSRAEAEGMNISVFHERFKPEMGLVVGVSYRVSIVKLHAGTPVDFALTSLVDGVPNGVFASQWSDDTCPYSDASFAGRLGKDKVTSHYSWSVPTSATQVRDANITFRLQYRFASDQRVFEVRTVFPLLKDCRLWLWPSTGQVSWQHLPRLSPCQLSFTTPPSPDTSAPTARGLVVDLTRLNVPCLSGGSLRLGTSATLLCGKLEELPVADRRFYFPSIQSSTTVITLHRNPLFSFTYHLVDYCYNVTLTKVNDSLVLKSTSSGLHCTFKIHLPYGNRISLKLKTNYGISVSGTGTRQNDLAEEDYRIGDLKSGEVPDAQPVIEYGEAFQEDPETSTVVQTFKSPQRSDKSKTEDYDETSLEYSKFDENTNEEYPEGRPIRKRYNDIIDDVKTLKSSTIPSPDDCSQFQVRILDGGDPIVSCNTSGEWNWRNISMLSKGNSLVVQVFVGEQLHGGQEVTFSYSAESVREVVRECGYGWVAVRQYCVTVVDDVRAAWNDAEAECVRRGGHLASVADDEAQAVVDNLLRNSAGYRDHNSYWIGASDRVNEGDFLWTDGQPFVYTNWFPGWEEHGHYNRQPNDDGFSDQDCVEIRRGYPNAGNQHRPPSLAGGSARLATSFMWNDRDCATNNFFVCETLKTGEPLLDDWRSDCNRSVVLTREQSVSIASPGFPQQYPDNAECQTTIVAPADHRIVVNFEELALEKEPNCSYDFLEILEDGGSKTASNGSVKPRKLCGDWSTKLKLLRYVSMGPRLRMRFVSDYSHHYGGFKVKVATENQVAPECGDEQLYLFNRSCYSFNSYSVVQWQTARQACKDAKAELASIRTLQEEIFVTSKIRESPDYKNGLIYWLGGQRSTDEEKTWLWTDNSTITFSAWSPGGSDSGACLALQWVASDLESRPSGLYWQAKACDAVGGFVCKRNQVSVSVLSLNRTVDSTEGFLTSPHFPSSYNNDLDYWVRLNGPAKTRIVVNFTHLDLEPQVDCLYDYVELRSTEGGGDVFRRCGNHGTNTSYPLSFVSKNNHAILHFHSDYSTSGKGFAANWQAVDISGCPLQTLHAQKGTLTSPNYPQFLLSHLDCESEIKAAASRRVWLEFVDYNFTNDASLELNLGGDVGSFKPFQLARQLNGGIFVSPFVSVRLKTGDRPTGIGFSAKYKTVAQIVSERTLVFSNTTTGSLCHLNYPGVAPNYVDFAERLIVPLGYTISLEFHGAFLSEDGSGCPENGGSILVSDNYAENNDTSWLLCENQSQKLVIQSYLNSLTVRQMSRGTAITMNATLRVVSDVTNYKLKLLKYPEDMNLESCSPKPCQNGGMCSKRRCKCTKYFTGPFCELTLCDRQPCLLGKCELTDDYYRCKCQPGYVGKTCDKKQRPCSSNPCEGRGVCKETSDEEYKCHCHAWWGGPKCETRLRIPFKPLSQRMLEEPFWLGLITVTVVLGVIGIIWCAKRHFPEKLEKLLAEEADRSRGGPSYSRPASVREQLAAAAGGATPVAVPSPTPAGGGCPRTLLGRLGIRKPSLLSLTSPHGHSHSATARTFSLDDLLKPPPRSKLGKTGLVGV